MYEALIKGENVMRTTEVLGTTISKLKFQGNPMRNETMVGKRILGIFVALQDVAGMFGTFGRSSEDSGTFTIQEKNKRL